MIEFARWLGPANFRPLVFIKLPARAGSSVRGTRFHVLWMHIRANFVLEGSMFIGIIFVPEEADFFNSF